MGSEYESYSRFRFLIAIVASMFFHLLLFMIFQNLNLVKEKEISKLSGPIYVTLEVQGEHPGLKKAPKILKTTDKNKTAVKNVEHVAKPVVDRNIEKQSKEISTIKTVNTHSSSVKPKSGVGVKGTEVPYSPQVGKKLISKKGEKASAVQEETGFVSGIKSGEQRVEEQKIVENKVKKKPLPFKPGVEIEEEPLAFNLEELQGTEEPSATVDGKEAQPGTSEYDKNLESESSELLEGIGSSKVIWEKPGISRRVISYGPKPKIPEWVKREGLKLEVTLLFNVDPDGHVLNVEVLKSSGYTEIDTLMMESVRKIIFEPIPINRVDKARITYVVIPR